MVGRILEIPSISQINPTGAGSDWCGRASACMMYNYYQLVAHGEAGRDRFIINDDDERDLVYPEEDGSHEVAALGDSGLYLLYEPLHRVLDERGEDTTGQAAPEPLFPAAHAYRSSLPLNEARTREVLQPIVDSIEANNPVLVYTGLSANAGNPRHIVVASGYRIRGESLWLRIDDPYVYETPTDNNKWGSIDVDDDLEVIDRGELGETGATYWIRAQMLFEKNGFSPPDDDYWCDHNDTPGLTIRRITHETPASPYAHSLGMTASLPVDLGEGLAVTPESVDHAYRIIETGPGGYFPVGAEAVWHGGVHLPTPGGADQFVHAPLTCPRNR